MHSDYSDELYRKGIKYLNAFEYESAIEILSKAIEQGNREACTPLGCAYSELEDYEMAYKWFTEDSKDLVKGASEFLIQGIEIDWPIVAFGGDYYLENGDYVNIDYVTLGWNVPLRSKYVQGLRVSLSVNNLATITGYSGLTPMVNSSLINGTLGIDDKNVLPVYRSYTMGISIKF